MVGRIRNMLDKLRRHPRTGHELLSVLVIAVVFVVAYAYWPFANPPTTATAASSGAPVSAAPQSAQVPAEIQHRGDSGEASWPPVAVSQPSFDSKQSSQTDVLSAEWRAQQDAAIEAAAAAQRRQEEQKDAWLEKRGVTSTVAPGGSSPEAPYPSGFEQPHRPNMPDCSYECMELQIP